MLARYNCNAPTRIATGSSKDAAISKTISIADITNGIPVNFPHAGKHSI
jgi:hypothetical protein